MKILQKSMGKDRQDSFWYHGIIAKTKTRILEACGDIGITYRGRTEWDEDAVAWALKMKWKDNDLKKVVWQNNNWFEVLSVERREDGVDFITGGEGEVAHTYKDAIKALKQLEAERND
jgi:hypothetical protein